MAWKVPEYSRGRVDAAGRVLIDDSVPVGQKELAWDIADNWRSSHAYPLNHFQNLLRGKVAKVDTTGIVVQRQKRRPSIELKLRDNPTMKLSQMQDLGGCRAIVGSVSAIYQIIELFEKSRMKHELSKLFDYIKEPKPSGYRGVHLVYRYISNSERHGVYSRQRIEVQLRSDLQHAWATAVEVAGTFRGEALKSSHGSRQWLRFFALMGSEIALTEDCPPVPGTPGDRGPLIKQLARQATKLKVTALLAGWAASMSFIHSGPADRAYYYVIELNLNERKVNITGYEDNHLAEAEAHRASKEKDAKEEVGLDVVLVSGDKLDQVKKAYPNYHLDTNVFLGMLERAIA